MGRRSLAAPLHGPFSPQKGGHLLDLAPESPLPRGASSPLDQHPLFTGALHARICLRGGAHALH